VDLATVLAVFVDASSVYVDAETQPLGDHVRARVGEAYAGAGFGCHSPVHEGDQVLIAYPGGNPDGEPVVLARLHHADAGVAGDVLDAAHDVWLVAKGDEKVRVKASAGVEVTAQTHVIGDTQVTGNVQVSGNETVGGSLVVNSTGAFAGGVTASGLTAGSLLIGGSPGYTGSVVVATPGGGSVTLTFEQGLLKMVS